MQPYPAITQSDPMQQMLGQVMGGYKPNQLGAGVTLGNPEAQQDYIAQLAQALADGEFSAKQIEQAGSLLTPEFIQNSGLAGVADMVLKTYVGKKMDEKGRTLQADAETRRMTAQEGVDERRAMKDAERASAAERAKAARAYEILRSGDPNLIAAHGLSAPKAEKYTPDWRERTKADGSTEFFDINGGPPQQARQEQRQQPAPRGPSNYRDAIASIESAGSGDYSALGPQTKTGDRAVGRYQVMGANIPEWTKAALGRSMTPEEFAASPEAQDAVFDHRFGQYAEKYGPEGAARAWFAGEGGMNKGGARDSLGTTVDEYGQKFSRNMGGMQEQYSDSASIPVPHTIPGDAPKKVEAKPSTIQQRQRDLSEMKAAGVPLTNGMAQYYLANGKMPDAPKPGGGKPNQLGAEAANKVGLYDNAIRSAKEWYDIVAEKDSKGNYTGGYNNTAAMSPRAQSLYRNAIRAKLRAESGASIPEGEEEGEMERYGSRWLGGDATDLGNATNLLKDLVQQRKMIVGSGGEKPTGFSVGQIIEKGGKKYRVVGGDPSDPEVEEVR